MKKTCKLIMTLFCWMIILMGNAYASSVIVENGTVQSVNEIAMRVMTINPNWALVSVPPNPSVYNAHTGNAFVGKGHAQLIINIVENGQKKKIVSATANMSITESFLIGGMSTTNVNPKYLKPLLTNIKAACDGRYVYGFECKKTKITYVTTGGPFALAGIKSGAHILSINGKKARSEDVNDINQKFNVHLVIKQDGKEKEVDIRGAYETPEQYQAELGI